MKEDDEDVKKLSKDIINLAKGLEETIKQAKALGIFTNERELLFCDECKLVEDVAFNGILFTYVNENEEIPQHRTVEDDDTGLRFVEIEYLKKYKCPKCGHIIEYTETDDDLFFTND